MFKQKMIDTVGEFHRIYKVKKGPLGHYVLLRNSLLWEEYGELQGAKSKVEELDALTDMLYIASGTLEQCDQTVWLRDLPAYGIRGLNNLMEAIEAATNEEAWVNLHAHLIDEVLEECEKRGFDIVGAFDEVHQSNLSKLDDEGKPIFSPRGKVLKGPNYAPPRLERFTVKDKHEPVAD
jgi:Phosphoribosyl-ATP pyrophosphohydrolase